MQFTVRSLGGKLIIVATVTLLLCLLLMMISSWIVLRFYAEYQNQRNAQNHLVSLQQVYQAHIQDLIQDLERTKQQLPLQAQEDQQAFPSLSQSLQRAQTTLATHDAITLLAILSPQYQFIAQGTIPTTTSPQTLAPDITHLISEARSGKTVTALTLSLLSPTQQTNQPTIVIVIPLTTNQAQPGNVLLATFPLNNSFAQLLTRQTETNIALCLTNHIIATTQNDIQQQLAQRTFSVQQLCHVGEPLTINNQQRTLVQGETLQTPFQSAHSLSLVVTTIEPLYTLNIGDTRPLLIILGIGIFVFAVGIIIYTFTTSVLLIRPLHRLQTQANTLITSNTGIQVGYSPIDEFSSLSHTFNLLSDSLYSESQALIEQMGYLLVLSDALMSTLNLEQLLGEFAYRIGNIMQVQHVSLQLYGREKNTPWAVAHWTPDKDWSNERGQISVHVDPEGDITMAATAKIIALPSPKSLQMSSKRGALRTPKLAQTNTTPNIGATSARYPQQTQRSRIPATALRDIDLSLARIAVQRQKIVYGEDMAQIYQNRKDNWAHIALENGYHSAIAIPLIFREQAIGAFILYMADPHKISSRDTFLLSTAAMQTSMAIQNAMLYAEVKDKNAALERANQLKSQFLANVTHELRTPLHSIISYGALILEGFVDGELTTEQEEHIQFMVNRAEDLSHLVDDMLDLSKIEADRIEIKAEPLIIEQSLTAVINQLKPIANTKNLFIRLEIDDHIPMALADNHRLRQITLNLISNAIKFTEKGGITIRCKTLQNRDMLCISVTDTGIGIAPAALNYIFEAFRQADGSTTRRFGGTGLGLTIAKKLIELQGGEIAVESVPGEGSTFSFILPTIGA